MGMQIFYTLEQNKYNLWKTGKSLISPSFGFCLWDWFWQDLAMQVEIFVNGNQVTDFNGEGILNDELKIRFKDIYVKEF